MTGLPTIHECVRRAAQCVGLTVGLGAGVLSAATVSVTDNVSTFQTLQGMNGAILADPKSDQQTGQYADDFVGDGVGGYYGFYTKFGQVGGVDTMLFRFRLNVMTTQQGNPKFTGNLRLGVDGDGDGDIDMYFGVSTGTNGQYPSIDFQSPTTSALNVSPNTSGLGNNFGTIAGTTSNFDYSQATDGSNYASGSGAGTPDADAFLTIAVPFSSFKTFLESQLSGVTITLDSFVRFVAFSSTQGNTVNQDVYGITGIDTVRYDQGGGFTNYYSASGKVVPEASTVAQLGAFVLSGLGVVWWRRKRSTARCRTA